MSAALRQPPSLAARVGRAIGMVLVFVAAGSPIGGLAFTLPGRRHLRQLGQQIRPHL